MPAFLKRSRPWIWFFLLLGLMAAVGLTVPIVYNLSLQLTPEQIERPKQMWRERGLTDYDFAYAEKLDPDTRIFIYNIQVRGGKVVGFSCNGATEPVTPGDEHQAHSIDGLFREIEASLKADAAKGGKRNYVTANFDKTDGHPVRYIRRESGTRNRLEWNVRAPVPVER